MTANRPITLAVVGFTAAILTCSAVIAQDKPSTGRPGLEPAASPAATTAPAAGVKPAEAGEILAAEGLGAKSLESKDINQLWEDFLHYLKVARPDLAASFGQAILASGVEPKEVYLLSVNTTGASTALARGEGLPGMADIVTRIRQMIEKGHEALRQDPKEIAGSIELLGGTVRGFEMGARRLVESGEYALPQLIQKLRDPATPLTLRERITEALPRLGKDAVRPLSVALQADDPALVEVLATAIGRIEYAHAAGRLKELAEKEGVLPRTKQAAETALVACAGKEILGKTVAAIFYDQAVNYYYQKESVAPDVRYPMANVWYWDAAAGLTYKVVPRAILCDVYAMRMCRLALAHDENFYPAVSLWIAANLKRQADMPEGATDPTYGAETPSAEFFALASSAKYLQDVLARGLTDRNSAVARGAIVALAQTAGAKNLVQPVAGGAQPLVEALSYADRHVRFLAAVSLANSLPDTRFTGCELVVPQLVQAIRQTGQKRAVVIVEDEALRNSLKDSIRAAGYDVIDNPDPAAAVAEAHKAIGVDVVVLAASPDPVRVIGTIRHDPFLATLPVVAAAKTEGLRALIGTDKKIVQIDSAADAAAVAAALKDAAALASGAEMTPDEAGEWAVRAAQSIEYLGVTSNKVFDVSIAVGALAAATQDPREPVRLAASRALAVIEKAEAQRAVAAVAVADGNAENVRIAAFGDLCASLRRYGNQLTDELAQQVLNVVKDEGSPELLNAAAQALGAMNLPSDKIKSLILATGN